MKKLMTATIVLLPILLLVILLVSGAIASQVSHIYVESVEFVDEKPITLRMPDEDAPPTYDVSSDITVIPLMAKNRDLIYTSDDESIVTIDEEGDLKAVYYGETYITVASREKPTAVARRKVIVTDKAVHKVAFKQYEAVMYKGDKPQQLSYEVFPAQANSAVSWSSSNSDILSVTQSGEVTCLGKGEVTITAASKENADIFATATISCNIQLEAISVETGRVTTAEDTAIFPAITAHPADATYSVEYTSSNEDIATVDGKGRITVHSAGAVEITATAKDGRGNTSAATVTYNFTHGYYMGPLFETSSFAFDYDTWAGETLSEIVLSKTPESAFRQILSVEISDPALISFDMEQEKFILNRVADDKPLGTVSVTIKAKKYNFATGELIEFEEDKCEIALTRNVKELSFASGGAAIDKLDMIEESIALSADAAKGGFGALAKPANHTNDISFAVTQGAETALIRGASLIFEAPGTVTITATAKDKEGNVRASASLSVTYTEPEDEDIPFEVTPESKDAQLVLDVHSNGAMERVLLTGTVPEGMTREVTVDNEEVISFENGYLIPKKGGFANVTISYEAAESIAPRRAAQPASAVCTIKIYVDKRVTAGDITVDKDGVTTSKESISYTLTLNVSEDAMAGKQLFVDGAPVEPEAKDGKLIYRGTKQFAQGQADVTLTVVVSYLDLIKEYDAEKSGEVCRAFATFHTTHGKLSAPAKVTYGAGQTIEAGAEKQSTISFGDLGEEVVLTIDARDPAPADFELKESDISLSQNRTFSYKYKQIGENLCTLTLTATEGGEEEIVLTIAGMVYRIHVEVTSLADTITVRYGSMTLGRETEYKTLLDALDFSVTISRTDGKAITEKKLDWSAGSDRGSEEGDTFFKVGGVALGEETREVVFTSGKASFTLHIQRTTLAEQELTYHLEYSVNGKDGVERCDPFEVGPEAGSIAFSFPKAMNGVFSICINGLDEEDFLGGVTREIMEAYFHVAGADGMDWGTPEISAATQKIVITLPAEHQFFVDAKLIFTCGDYSVTLVLSRNDIESVAFTGFDSNNKLNGGDIYKGYQQVRVFAKHSDYGAGMVDYFKVPLVVMNDIANGTHAQDLSLLSWTFTGYKGNEKTAFTAVQRGDKVTFGGVEYTIAKSGNGCVLQKADGTVVVGADGKYAANAPLVPWVDIYSEPYNEETGEGGYARIYFGAFQGLAETDVQNDYFGNFAEKEGWEQKAPVEDDDSGRFFGTTDGSFTFLRIAADTGAQGGAGAHFNFNVLADDELCNVFNATGYYAHSKVVLHENLYGEGELDADSAKAQQARERDLILTKSDGAKNTTDTNVLGKSVIHGNGYQINLQAKNELIKQNNLKRNDNYGVQFGALYNLNLKGSNPEKDEVINTARQQMIWIAQYAYYCDIQLYSKGRPLGNAYVKNSVLHTASFCAFQLHEKDEHAYFENVVVVDCATGITCENAKVSGPEYWHFKGFFDVLNYKSLRGILTMASDAVNEQTLGLLEMLAINDIVTYYEWFGGSYKAADIGTYLMPYINLVVYTSTNKGSYNFWDEEKHSYVENNTSGTVSGGMPMKLALDLSPYSGWIGGSQVTAWTYDYRGGTYYDPGAEGRSPGQMSGTQDLSKLFIEERYIRLLCEYKTSSKDFKTLEKNEDHILWHMEQVYRDMTLVWKGYDKAHPELGIEQDHIKALRDSLKGTTWPDGSGVDKDGNVFDASGAVLARMLSETTLPGKEEA